MPDQLSFDTLAIHADPRDERSVSPPIYQTSTFFAPDADSFLESSTGPQAGSPIRETISGTTATFNFPNEGVFGFWCEEHGVAMMGAIYVEP